MKDYPERGFAIFHLDTEIVPPHAHLQIDSLSPLTDDIAEMMGDYRLFTIGYNMDKDRELFDSCARQYTTTLSPLEKLALGSVDSGILARVSCLHTSRRPKRLIAFSLPISIHP